MYAVRQSSMGAAPRLRRTFGGVAPAHREAFMAGLTWLDIDRLIQAMRDWSDEPMIVGWCQRMLSIANDELCGYEPD